MPRYSFDDPESEHQDSLPSPSPSPPSPSRQQHSLPPSFYSSQIPQDLFSAACYPTTRFQSVTEPFRAAPRYSQVRSSHSASASISPTRSHRPSDYASAASVSPIFDAAPIPPPHRDTQDRPWGRGLQDTSSSHLLATARHDKQESTFDNAGLGGVAMSVADAHPRASGIEAMQNTPAHDPRDLYPYNDVFSRLSPRGDISSTSLTPLGSNAIPPGMQTPNSRSTASASRSLNSENPYSDTGYPYSQRQSRNLEDLDPSMGFDPNTIEDDGDDGLHYGQPATRGSMLSLGHASDQPRGVPTAAAKGGMLSSLGGLIGRKSSGDHYDPANAHVAPGGLEYNLDGEKGASMAKASKKKRKKWCIIAFGAMLLAGAIVGGIVGGIVTSRSDSAETNSGVSAASDTASNGDLDKNSPEIVRLMNNNQLHKVFPGIDYTPMNTQYPECIHDPPSPNNVTRDLAVLSQLTNTLRLYGTDCNQTEMLMHSISQLGLDDSMRVWLGVWQDTNHTTNTRQIEQLYTILDNYDPSRFLGVIIGNEVLYREDMTEAELIDVIDNVRSNLTDRNIDIPVAASDLGDDWTADFASKVDYVMANIHPFFAGVSADEAASWTYDFWQTHDVPLVTDKSKCIISETGWPSSGGTNCGAATTCTVGSLASIDEMNKFLDTWVCQALENGTNYFWFESFDEPWKVKYNTGDDNWEDKWGLLTVNRVLKDGVMIPDCGGKTVS